MKSSKQHPHTKKFQSYPYGGWKPILFAILISVLFHPKDLRAQISGSFASSKGTNIVINLTVSKPAPSNVIVVQEFSPNNQIVSTSPRAKKIGKNGKIKWLFRNTSPGNFQISTLLKKPLQGTVSAVIRFRNPATGQFTEVNISS